MQFSSINTITKQKYQLDQDLIAPGDKVYWTSAQLEFAKITTVEQHLVEGNDPHNLYTTYNGYTAVFDHTGKLYGIQNVLLATIDNFDLLHKQHPTMLIEHP